MCMGKYTGSKQVIAMTMQVGISHLRLITSAVDLYAARTIRMQAGIQKHRQQQESSQMKKKKTKLKKFTYSWPSVGTIFDKQILYEK